MSSLLRKIKKNQEKTEMKNLYGKTPKHICHECKKMTLWKKDQEGKPRCVRCGK